jgi:hypothetical protein
MSNSESDNKQDRVRDALGRFKIIKINDVDELVVLLAKILSLIKNKQSNFNLKMIVVDSLSSLFSGVSLK